MRLFQKCTSDRSIHTWGGHSPRCCGVPARTSPPYSLQAVYPAALFNAAFGGAFSAVQLPAQTAGAVVAETVMTLFLTSVVCLGVANARTRSQMAPLCIGLTLSSCVLAG